MSDDLVKRLREVKDWWREPGRTAEQAADRIEQLEAVLLLIANTDPAGDQHWPGRIARAALEKKDD